MQHARQSNSLFFAGLSFLELLFHSIVREVRTESGSASLGIMKEAVQILLFAGFFLVLNVVMGRGVAIRGDFIIYLLSGVFLLVTHMGAMKSVMSASNAISPMMMHAPMSVMLAILASAIGGLYMRTVALIVLLVGYRFFAGEIAVADPAGLLLPFFLAWASGLAIGLVFMLVKPLAPKLVQSIASIYMRLQMFTSGKFIPAAILPASMLPWFEWNPLFHCIDQMRLALFVNYSREVSSPTYAIYVTLVFLTIGMMGEFWMRNNLSKSKHSK